MATGALSLSKQRKLPARRLTVIAAAVAAIRGSREGNRIMKLRIREEDQSYEVEVEILEDQAPAPPDPDFDIPGAVLRRRAAQRLPEDAVCRTPIAGLVTEVRVSEGQHVRKDQGVVVVEAMKMENRIGPAVDGVVKVVHVRSGDAVKPGQVLFELV